ncbi:hypothetical protein LQZ24_01985 [Fructobacillus sp. M1-13]|uniref:DUF5590 domain-containing protein n=1 Tax=Fructobacillus papyriferae TaxID=2713171 RepID=A0ABS5QNU1_9LACO|nr:hypothetical protein [Fructobacillus papyriferae]MBS9334809.1 hypothetical protein [Fructobacillus papyriferae]MCD2158799.1 hypothetical protein [Fructobacillus papyriferae]
MEIHDNLRVNMARPKRFSWSKFFVIILAFVIVIGAGLAIYAYLALRPMAKAESNVQAVVKQKTQLTNLHDMTVDYRDGSTYAVIGSENGKEKVAIIHGKSSKVKVFDFGNGMTKVQLKAKLKGDYQAKKIYSANLSEYQNALVWELSYQGKDGSLNYLTLDYKNGTVYRAVNGL